METRGISQFKARALKVLDRVAKTREGIVITRRGEPVAQVLPISGSDARGKMGSLADTLVFEKDILSPLGKETWECSG